MDVVRTLKDISELVSYLVVIVGFSLGLVTYSRAGAAERRAREDERRARLEEQAAREMRVYDEVDNRFIEYQKVCLAYPYLDVADIPDTTPPTLDPLQRKQELIVLAMLFALFESAYLLHHGNPTEVTKSQWAGWEQQITNYMTRPNIRAGWRITGTTYDRSFTHFLEALLAAIPERPMPNQA